MPLSFDLTTTFSLLQQGRAKPALKAAKSGMRTYKKHPAFANFAGLALTSMGKQRDAIDMFQKAIKLDPNFVDARKNLVQTLILFDRPDAALKHLDRMTRAQPKDESIWYLMAQAQANMGHPRAALDAANTAIKIDATKPRTYNLRALVRDQLGQQNQALADYHAALQMAPNNVEALVNISLPLARATQYDAAIEVVRRAVSLAPEHIGARLRLGSQLAEMGETTEAIEALHQVLALAPDNVLAIEKLAGLQSAAQNQSLISVAQKGLKSTRRTPVERASLLFALARMAQQNTDHKTASGYWNEANREMAKTLPYDAVADSALNSKILGHFTKVEPTPTGHVAKPTPIFIVGLPRSGTTLTEAILAAHRNIKSLGERATAGILLYPLIDQNLEFDRDAQAEFARQYLHSLPDMPAETQAFVDKMPENYRLIGFLQRAFPKCRIINMRRDPRDIALSMWRERFSGTALAYTYDLAAMAHRFNLYAEAMAHWHRIFPGQIFDLSYEDMVADVKNISQKLAKFCTVEWVPQMARPDQNAEQILTMSAGQLRQPVHTRSIGKWRQHQDMLSPFISGLNPDLWPELA